MLKHRTVLATIATLILAISTLVAATPAQASSTWWAITKVYFDSPGSDTGSNTSVNAEYVIIKNISSSTHALTGYVLRDAQSHRYTFGTYSLTGGASVYVHTGKGSNTAHVRYWGMGYYVWNNTGDTASLYNYKGVLADRCSYTSANDPVKYC